MSTASLLTDSASLAIAGGGALTVIGFVVRGGWKAIGRGRRFLDDYEGTPERHGVPARPGVMGRLQMIDERQLEAEHKVAAITDSLAGLSKRVDHIADELPKNGMPTARKVDLIIQHLGIDTSAAKHD